MYSARVSVHPERRLVGGVARGDWDAAGWRVELLTAID
jgi:hypothetical protein